LLKVQQESTFDRRVEHPGEAAVELADHGGEEILSAKGRAIEYLSEREEPDGKRTWTRATRWIDLELNVGFVFVASRFMQSIWDVARARYCKQLPEAGLNFYDKQPLFDDMFLGMDPIKVMTMHMPLLYYADDLPDSPKSGSAE
jgi:hypothetical protein